ncbi:hypothetical protein QTP70_020203 [Hemibagrus guttatus]|uniref:Uncharacterized protein n=1 Tax=Hemibagrus guttatus TaxID=175788 RepID=A0AAE0PXF1_9TELE|nr:hypothetical protein QTP70_020203 [Hemibagrus guttatus]
MKPYCCSQISTTFLNLASTTLSHSFIQPDNMDNSHSDSETVDQAKSASDTQNAINGSGVVQEEPKASDGPSTGSTVEMKAVEADGPSTVSTVEMKDVEAGKMTDMFSGNKVFLLVTGNTLNAHEKVMEILKTQKPDLQVVEKVDESDYVLVFCPIVSRAGTDIEAALKKLQDIAGSKPALLVVLHHTFDTDCVVPESTRAVKRNNSIAVDCLFHEDLGLLQSPKNTESLRKNFKHYKTPGFKTKASMKKGGEKKQELKTEEKVVTVQLHQNTEFFHLDYLIR